jgi:hypothetical protein
VGQVDVYLNGAKLIEGDDYVANGSGITGLDALTSGDVLEVVARDYRPTTTGIPSTSQANDWTASQSFPDGTQSAPSIRFSSDTNNGFYKAGIDSMGVSKDLSLESINGAQVSGFRNLLINGRLDIWQRGTSLSDGGTNRYLADRFSVISGTSTEAQSRQSFSNGQTDVPGNPKYFHRTVVTNNTGSTSVVLFNQRIENVATLSGNKATVSFWLKTDAVREIAIELYQLFGSGGSPSSGVSIPAGKFSTSTTWTKYTATVDIPSISGKTIGTNSDDNLRLLIWYTAGSSYSSRSSGLGEQSGTFDIAMLQLEEGPRATAFEQRPIWVELPMCYRYYWKSHIWGGAWHVGYVASGSVYYDTVNFPVQMRATPTMSYTNSINNLFGTTGTFQQITTFGYNFYRTASGTGNAGYFGTQVYADAEL